MTHTSTVGELTRLAENKDFEEVLARFRDFPHEEILAAADFLLDHDIYHVSMELYQYLLTEDESADAHFGIGVCHGKCYDYDSALKHLDLAFATNPNRTAGAGYYAYILERHERMDDADRWYRASLAGAEADDLWARSHYAWFLEKWGRTDDACAAYADTLSRNAAYTWASKRYALLLRKLGDDAQAREVLQASVKSAPGLVAGLNLLEYLLISQDDAAYVEFRATLDPGKGPAWYPVVLSLFDYYREHLLPSNPDAAKITAFEQAAAVLKDSVHRDFDDLTALLGERGGDVAEWRRLIKLLLK
ncbi:tetratricopeptide repeat protein [Actinokineospora sp. HUAS TT18]|uniref:tetratricopeptide repeat protein n=1 Tax=Actinokineospora sp. HUAS TT18 TaxID=3447451 RepID=UPI003F51D094